MTYAGTQCVTFRTDAQQNLIAFAGNQCRQITVDGKTTVFADQDIPQFAYAPVLESRRVPGGAVLQIRVSGTGTLRIPAVQLPANPKLYAEGKTPGSRGDRIDCRIENGSLVFAAHLPHQGRWLYVTSGS